MCPGLISELMRRLCISPPAIHAAQSWRRRGYEAEEASHRINLFRTVYSFYRIRVFSN